MAQKPILETMIMDILWDAESGLTPGEVRERMRDRPDVAYTTVMTVMARLFKKGRLLRTRQGRAYAYEPTESRAEFAARRMEELLHAAGDRSTALARFLENLSASERRDVLRELNKR